MTNGVLVIDSREKKGSPLVDLVTSRADKLLIRYEKKWIEVGDYVFDDVCFEAKSAVDFLGSVLSKRIWTQVDNMDRNYKHSIVIIYGSIESATDTVIEYGRSKQPAWGREVMLRKKFLGAIGRITLDSDVRAFWVPSADDAADIITSICKMKPLNRQAINPQIIKRISTDDLRLDMLTCVKGISNKKAKKLIKKFGSIMEIALSKHEELTSIEGIGPTLATRILEVLNTEMKVKI
tara:strand:+ start:5654 stop:6361 length:708 start_codon:yes stop_codon:yes gene_type:complete